MSIVHGKGLPLSAISAMRIMLPLKYRPWLTFRKRWLDKLINSGRTFPFHSIAWKRKARIVQPNYHHHRNLGCKLLLVERNMDSVRERENAA